MASGNNDAQDMPSSAPAPVDTAETPVEQGNQATTQSNPFGPLSLLGLGLLLETAGWITRQVNPAQPADSAARDDQPQTQSDGAIRRSVLIGLIAEARTRAGEQREAARQTRRNVLRRLSKAAAPFSRWLPVEVALTATEILADYGQRTVEKTVDRLARQGRIEEERARELAQRALIGWINEALTYVTHDPEVRDLVTQQGEDLATSALDELRTRSESVDTWLAQTTSRVLKRSNQAKAPAPTDTAVSPTISSNGAGN